MFNISSSFVKEIEQQLIIIFKIKSWTKKMRIPKFVIDIPSFIAARTTITHDLFPFDFHFLRYAVLRHFTLLTIGRYKGRIPVRSARRWGWQLWRIFFIHVTCLRARKNTFSRSKPGSNQGNRTSTYVSRLEPSILKFSPSQVYSLVPFDQDRRVNVKQFGRKAGQLWLWQTLTCM